VTDEIAAHFANSAVVSRLSEKTPAERRSAIVELEARLRDFPQFDFDANLTHHFSHGVYSRELFMPAGVVVVGKIHRHTCFNVIQHGRVWVVTEGEGLQELIGPTVWVSSPGTKRAVYVMEDTVWITCHGSHETDLARLEAEVIVPSYAALEAEQRAQLEGPKT